MTQISSVDLYFWVIFIRKVSDLSEPNYPIWWVRLRHTSSLQFVCTKKWCGYHIIWSALIPWLHGKEMSAGNCLAQGSLACDSGKEFVSPVLWGELALLLCYWDLCFHPVILGFLSTIFYWPQFKAVCWFKTSVFHKFLPFFLHHWVIQWAFQKDLHVFQLHHLTASIVYFKCLYRPPQAQCVVNPAISSAVQLHSASVTHRSSAGEESWWATSLVMCIWHMDRKGNYLLTPLGLYLRLWTPKSICSFLGHPFKMPAERNIDYWHGLSLYLNLHQDYAQTPNL